MSVPFQFPQPVRSSGPTTQRTVPPRPATPPATPPQMTKTKPDVNKTRNFGGFNVNPALNITVVGTNNNGSAPAAPGPGGGGSSPAGTGTPGSGFASNEDIQAFSEAVRKQARNRAVERAMDAEQLEQVLRHIPTPDGSMAGARLRARRVSRHAKKIAKAEQEIAKAAAALHAQFQREFESELSKVGKARPPQPTRFTF